MKEKIKLQVRHLTKKFGDLLVLNDVSFDVKEGEFLCIVGPTGCGKTTFLNSVTKLYEPTSGEILFDGESVDLHKHNITYIFQEYSAMEWLTVRENVRFGLEIKKDFKDINKKVDDALELVGLKAFENYYPRQLSASMLQRVVIARAFATRPSLLLMDEPYGQLDINLRFKLEDEVVRLCTNKPTSIKESVVDSFARPRNVADPEFIKMRNYITEQIKWW